MNVITANDLKLQGVGILQEMLEDNSEVSISVRGHERFVAMTQDHYNYLRECEILAALAETKEDIANGRFYVESVEAHLKRVKNGV